MRTPQTELEQGLSAKVLCTVADACRMTSISKTEVYNLLNQNAWESFKYGKKRLIVTASILAWSNEMNFLAKLNKEN